MNKTELIASIAEKSGISRKDAEKALAAFMETVVESVANDEKVQIIGFGTFELRERSERTGRDPRTNREILIPASKAPAFKVGKAFKEAVNK